MVINIIKLILDILELYLYLVIINIKTSNKEFFE